MTAGGRVAKAGRDAEENADGRVFAGGHLALPPAASADPIELQWWHAMTAVNGERINKIAADFNASQTDYKILPVFKGSYAETMTGAIAAFRAGNGPMSCRVFEVGTATMMAAKVRSNRSIS
jgi:sn-glycerol 3-phosphate transport system substrate-binding protein